MNFLNKISETNKDKLLLQIKDWNHMVNEKDESFKNDYFIDLEKIRVSSELIYSLDHYNKEYLESEVIVGIQENEDVNGKTFSYRFVQIKSDTWSDSWSELSDPVTASFQSVEATTSSCVQQSVISCGNIFVNFTVNIIFKSS